MSAATHLPTVAGFEVWAYATDPHPSDVAEGLVEFTVPAEICEPTLEEHAVLLPLTAWRGSSRERIGSWCPTCGRRLIA